MIARLDARLWIKSASEDQGRKNKHGNLFWPAKPQVDRRHVTNAGKYTEIGVQNSQAVQCSCGHNRWADKWINATYTVQEQLGTHKTEGARKADTSEPSHQEQNSKHRHVLVQAVELIERQAASASFDRAERQAKARERQANR